MNRRSFLLRAALGAFAIAARVLGQGGETSNRSVSAARPPEPWRTENADALSRWRAAVRRPVVEGEAAELRLLAEAVRRGRRVCFRYFGGSESGAAREVAPGLLYTVDGFDGVYLSGYCHARRAERTFLVARMGDLEVEAA